MNNVYRIRRSDESKICRSKPASEHEDEYVHKLMIEVPFIEISRIHKMPSERWGIEFDELLFKAACGHFKYPEEK